MHSFQLNDAGKRRENVGLGIMLGKYLDTANNSAAPIVDSFWKNEEVIWKKGRGGGNHKLHHNDELYSVTYSLGEGRILFTQTFFWRDILCSDSIE